MSPAWELVTRDLSRRRALLLGISGLTVLATLPIVGHHLLGSGANLLEGRDNIGNLCLVALHSLLAPVHYGFHVALILGLLYAVADRARAWARLRRTIGKLRLDVVPQTGPFADALAKCGASRQEAVVVEGLPNPAFTAGWWKPRIYLDSRLASRLSVPELESLVAHEAAHLQRRDPMRLAVLRFFACLVFWLPALRRLAEDVADEAEFEADDIARGRQPLVLASAILNVALWTAGTEPLGGAVAFASPNLIEQRVRRLSEDVSPSRTHVTTRSLVAAAMMLLAALGSGIVMAHPIASAPKVGAIAPRNGESHSGHKGECTKHQGLAVSHLFCDGLPFGLRSTYCPSHNMAKTT